MGDGHLAQKMRAALPYQLTRSQEQALAEIKSDMASSRRMLRLLQGDVGAGKTVVAALAMAASGRGWGAGRDHGADRCARAAAP